MSEHEKLNADALKALAARPEKEYCSLEDNEGYVTGYLYSESEHRAAVAALRDQSAVVRDTIQACIQVVFEQSYALEHVNGERCDTEKLVKALDALKDRPEVAALRGQTCATCRHWKVIPETKGERLAASMNTGKHPCAIGVGRHGNSYTAPDFGCTLHEPAPVPPAARPAPGGPVSRAERILRWNHKRHAQGLCHRCGRKNPRWPKWDCLPCSLVHKERKQRKRLSEPRVSQGEESQS